MKAIRQCSAPLVASAGAFAMGAALLSGFWHGDFFIEGSLLMQLPWGRATLVDVYVGLVLFSGWIIRRERSGPVAALWVAAVLAGGNLAACLYVFRAAARSQGNARQFWMGVGREA
jgi:hypothetical protein